jgi:putative membrane protein
MYSKIFQQAITNILPFILIGISLYVILREEKPIMAGVIFSLAGILGIVSLNQPINEPLLPLLTGLFGTSGMILSLKNNNKLPPQISTPLKEIKISRKELISVLIAAIVAAPIGSFLPALGSGYAALIGSEVRELSRKAFLLLNGLLNTTIMMMSFVMIFTLNKARTGAAAAISELLTKISISDLMIMLIIGTITILCAFILGVYLSKVSAKFISQVSYPIISGMIIIFVTLLVVILSGFIGALVLVTATSLGIFTVRSNVKRTTLMGCLIVPTIIYYLI